MHQSSVEHFDTAVTALSDPCHGNRVNPPHPSKLVTIAKKMYFPYVEPITVVLFWMS